MISAKKNLQHLHPSDFDDVAQKRLKMALKMIVEGWYGGQLTSYAFSSNLRLWFGDIMVRDTIAVAWIFGGPT